MKKILASAKTIFAPENKNLVLRSLREGWTQIWRHKFLSITSLLLGSLILVLLSLVFAVKFFADFSLQNLEKRADFSVFLRENTDWFALQSLQNELEKLPVQSEILQAQSIENFQIPSRLHVKFLDLRAVSPALEILKKPRYDQVVGDWDAVGEREFALLVQRLLAIGNGLEIAGFWLVGLFLVGGGLLAINTFRIVLFARKKEILIAQFVGADAKFIFGPFLVEGFLLGLFSSLVAILVFTLLLRQISLAGILPGGEIFLYFWNHIFVLQIFCSALVGAAGAQIAALPYFVKKPIKTP